MNAKHTPAPWHISNQGGRKAVLTNSAAKATAEIENGGFIIAELYGIDKSENAHLIAAAPELMMALHDLIELIDDLYGESSVIDEDIMQGEQYAAALAAINKAKGEQP